MGRWLTKSLFVEFAYQDVHPEESLFTLQDEDRLGVPSLYRLYMEMRDPSEYYFAKQYLGGWDHWERLSKSPWFKPYIESWRKELEALIRAEALKEIIRIAKDSSHKSSYEANKILLRDKSQPKRGRPSKDEVTKEATRIASEEDRVQKDAERILQ